MYRSATTATLASVTGKISGPGVTNFSGCTVILHASKGSAARIGPVEADGTYRIAGVPAGKWRATCVPSPTTPLAAMTYKAHPGYQTSAATLITVPASGTVKASIALRAAAPLQVMVVNEAGDPIEGAYVWAYEASVSAPTGTPATAGPLGSATLTNVPLTAKIFAFDPVGQSAIWWNGAKSWQAATVVKLPGQGDGISITATLPE
jgi:hypothetical protein